MQKTKTIRKSEIKRDWHLIDAQDRILGRLATQIATLLMGKQKSSLVPHLDGGDFVVVFNAAKIRVTGKKEKQKVYYRHSGYPGGLKERIFAKQMSLDPKKILRHAVAGMLPKNKLRMPRLKRLKIFVGKKHSYGDKIK